MNPRNLVHVSQKENYCLHSILSNCVQMINANANKILTVILKGKLTLETQVRFNRAGLVSETSPRHSGVHVNVLLNKSDVVQNHKQNADDGQNKIQTRIYIQ